MLVVMDAAVGTERRRDETQRIDAPGAAAFAKAASRRPVLAAACGAKLLTWSALGPHSLPPRPSPVDRSSALPPRPKGVTAPARGSLPMPTRPRYWRGSSGEGGGGHGVRRRPLKLSCGKFDQGVAGDGGWWGSPPHLVLLSVRRRARDPGRRRRNRSTLGCDRTLSERLGGPLFGRQEHHLLRARPGACAT